MHLILKMFFTNSTPKLISFLVLGTVLCQSCNPWELKSQQASHWPLRKSAGKRKEWGCMPLALMANWVTFLWHWKSPQKSPGLSLAFHRYTHSPADLTQEKHLKKYLVVRMVSHSTLEKEARLLIYLSYSALKNETLVGPLSNVHS
jgi:hypothetical protein